ncbi:MAG TPA: UDP-N-acetylmuramate dehydrogenase [Bacteroidales bacterium]|nr:UDP-N-acetylmuramate dehydrogenase [Bacteroidales bacterium]
MNIQHNIELKPYNSFRTKAKAKLFSEPKTVEELCQVVKQYTNEKILILGNGYNLFFTKDYNGLVIHPLMKGINVCYENDKVVDIEVNAAENWDDFVAYCVANNYAGVENLSLIPSSVGAVPVQNIGAYGTEVKEVITRVKTVNIESGKQKEFTNEMCEFGYRDSVFKRTGKYIITSVIFRLQKEFIYKPKYKDVVSELAGIEAPTMADVRNAVVNIRTRKLPDYDILPNAGSFFKNPFLTNDEKESLLRLLPDATIHKVNESCFKTSAAFLIDRAGFRNKRNKMVGTYKNHSLIIVNYGTEEGKEIVDFMKEVQKSVYSHFKIWLEPEVRVY